MYFKVPSDFVYSDTYKFEKEQNGEKVNPINFYYNDLTPEEYKILVELSNKTSQSFD